MKQFFEEYGGIIIIILVLAGLLAIVGGADSGLIKEMGSKISEWFGKFFTFISF